jgi:hypothetical protein
VRSENKDHLATFLKVNYHKKSILLNYSYRYCIQHSLVLLLIQVSAHSLKDMKITIQNVITYLNYCCILLDLIVIFNVVINIILVTENFISMSSCYIISTPCFLSWKPKTSIKTFNENSFILNKTIKHLRRSSM